MVGANGSTGPLVVTTLCHGNEFCNVTANLLSQVCSNVQVEPQLQPLSGETLSHCTHSYINKSLLMRTVPETFCRDIQSGMVIRIGS